MKSNDKKCSTWNSYTIEHTTMPFSSVLKIHLIVLLLTNLLKNRWPLIGEIIERRIVFSKRAFILSNKFSSDYLYILLCIVMFHVEQHSIEINISKFRLVPFYRLFDMFSIYWFTKPMLINRSIHDTSFDLSLLSSCVWDDKFRIWILPKVNWIVPRGTFIVCITASYGDWDRKSVV